MRMYVCCAILTTFLVEYIFGHTMKSLSLLITKFVLLEDWTYALVVMIQLNIKWVTAPCYLA
ncbi:hypothetical protein LINPERHAP2_LOCUS36535, partial [Linum perenne]